MGMAVLNWGMCCPHQRKIPKCFTAAVGGFEYGTTVVQETSVNNPFTKDSAPGSICYKTRLIKGNLQPQTFSKCAAAKCMKIRATRKRLNTVRVHESLMCLIFLYFFLFLSMSILKPLTKTSYKSGFADIF